MKITDVRAHHIRIPYDAGPASFRQGASAISALDMVVVEVVTDGGLTGWGDAFAYARDRMQIFLRLYIFSRNMACVAFSGALIIVVMAIYQRLRFASRKGTCRAFFIALWQGGAHVPPAAETAQADASVAIPNWLSSRINLFLIFLIFGLGLLYRHVMFLRLYAGEALMAYAASANP